MAREAIRRRSAKDLLSVLPMSAEDIGPLIHQVGPTVDALYPRGAERLLKRLEDSRDGYAQALVVKSSGSSVPLALAASVGKGDGRSKLSTFWVSPFRRRTGVGQILLDQVLMTWCRHDLVETSYITSRVGGVPGIAELFRRNGYSIVACIEDRYGPGKSELVLGWDRAAGAGEALRVS